MENSNCVLIPKKDYDALVKKAEAVKPDKIEIRCIYGPYYGDVRTFEGTIDLARPLSWKILNIFFLIRKDYRCSIQKEVKEEVEYLKRTFNTLPWYKKMFYKFEL